MPETLLRKKPQDPCEDVEKRCKSLRDWAKEQGHWPVIIKEDDNVRSIIKYTVSIQVKL